MSRGGLQFIKKKYTTKSLDKKITAYFKYCDTHKPNDEIRHNNICRSKPYTEEHLALFIGFSSHEMYIYSTDDDFKEFHESLERAQQKIVGSWIVGGLLGEYNVGAIKFLLPHMSRYKQIAPEDEKIVSDELKAITFYHREEENKKELEKKYIDVEIEEE